jgi:hypothetical protein
MLSIFKKNKEVKIEEKVKTLAELKEELIDNTKHLSNIHLFLSFFIGKKYEVKYTDIKINEYKLIDGSYNIIYTLDDKVNDIFIEQISLMSFIFVQVNSEYFGSERMFSKDL